MFSLARTLLSPDSAEDHSSLFVWFIDTMARSDSSRACASAVWFFAFADRPRSLSGRGAPEVSRFSCVEFPNMQGSQTSQSPMDARIRASTDVVFRLKGRRRHSDLRTFRGSIPCLPVPLSTLHVQPCNCSTRMTRSRCGLLGLHRTALSSAPPRRFIPAHPSQYPHGRLPRLTAREDQKIAEDFSSLLPDVA